MNKKLIKQFTDTFMEGDSYYIVVNRCQNDDLYYSRLKSIMKQHKKDLAIWGDELDYSRYAYGRLSNILKKDNTPYQMKLVKVRGKVYIGERFYEEGKGGYIELREYRSPISIEDEVYEVI